MSEFSVGRKCGLRGRVAEIFSDGTKKWVICFQKIIHGADLILGHWTLVTVKNRDFRPKIGQNSAIGEIEVAENVPSGCATAEKISA